MFDDAVREVGRRGSGATCAAVQLAPPRSADNDEDRRADREDVAAEPATNRPFDATPNRHDCARPRISTAIARTHDSKLVQRGECGQPPYDRLRTSAALWNSLSEIETETPAGGTPPNATALCAIQRFRFEVQYARCSHACAAATVSNTRDPFA
jgi:hypothetical protein